MALGNNEFKSSGTLVFLTPRKKNKAGEEVKPYFSVARLVNEKIEQSEETFTNVSGDLVRLDVKEKVFNDNPMKEAILYLRDSQANETYRLSLTFSMAARGLFNSLAGLLAKKNFNDLSVDIYENKNGYETYALKQKGEKTAWKHELSALPAPFEMKDAKGKVSKRDYSPIDDFFEKELLEIAAVVNKAPASNANTATSGTSKPSTVTNEVKPVTAATPAVDDESVPF